MYGKGDLDDFQHKNVECVSCIPLYSEVLLFFDSFMEYQSMISNYY